VTIKEAKSSVVGNYTVYEINDDGECWSWTDEMFEPAYANGGYVPYHKIPTPKKPVSIEEQLRLPKGVSIHDHFCDGFRENKKPECVLNEKQAKEYADNIIATSELISHMTGIPCENSINKLKTCLSASSNDGISAKNGGKNSMKFTFYTEEGYRIDKSNNSKVETITTFVKINGFDNTYLGMATCDKVDYSEREGVINALANAMCNGNFDREFNKAVKDNARADKKARTCTYCGQLFDTVAEKEVHEAWHVERKKARRERYLLRKRAKEIAFEEQAQKMAKEMMGEQK
jgi:hypothetical protein